MSAERRFNIGQLVMLNKDAMLTRLGLHFTPEKAYLVEETRCNEEPIILIKDDRGYLGPHLEQFFVNYKTKH